MFFRESEFVSEMENMEFSGCWLSVPAFRLQGPHSGASSFAGNTPVLRPIASHKAAQGQHGGILLLSVQGTAAFSCSADKVGPGFCPETALAAARGKPDALLATPKGG